jgi:hypothetical protein
LRSYFGYIDHIKEKKIPLPRLISEDDVVADHKILEVPRVIRTIDTGFPAEEYDIADMDDSRAWTGGASY